jgi:predicted ATP-grasp superfamily ATP-dependent carboligase
MALPPAIVVGAELNGLGVARPLARAGIPVWGIATGEPHPAERSRAFARVVRCREWSEQGLLEVLDRLGRDLDAGGFDARAPLLPTKDEPVLWLSRHRDELASRFLLNLPDDPTVQLLMNKRQFLECALREGWPMPRTILAGSLEELERLAPEVPFPCILKPELKNERFRRQPIPKTFKLENREQLFAAYRRVAPFEAQVIVSEFIPGPDSQLLSCRTYWDTHGEPIANFAVQKLLQWPVEIGIMALAGPCPPELRERVVSLSERIFRAVGFRGLGALEVKLRPDGSPVITEPCVGRTVYSGEIAALNGIDLPAIAYHDMVLGRNVAPPGATLGAPLGEPVKLDDGVRSRKSGAAYRARGLLEAEQVRALRAGARLDMLWRADDPGPGLAAIGRAVKRSLARPVRHLIGSGR